MNERNTRSARLLVQIVSALVALSLAFWAWSDDSLLGGGAGFGATQAALLGVAVLLGASCLLPLAWNGRALALVLSTGFVLVVIEFALQLLLSARYRAENRFDAQLLYRPVPGATVEYKRDPINGGDRILYRINSHGFRGDELAPDPEFRIALYGDSFVHGYFSTLENTFAERLELRASEHGIPVEVVNAGVSGYGPDQALKRMQQELAELKPDLVILAVFTGNDFGDLARNKLYRPNGERDVRENEFSVAPALQREMEVHQRELILKRVVRAGVKALARRLGLQVGSTSEVESMTPTERIDYFLAQHLREYEEFVVNGDNEVRELAWDSYDADVSLTPDSDSARFKIALMDGILGRVQRVAAQVGAPVLLVPIPHPLDVGVHEPLAVDRAKYPQYRPRGLVAILEQIAERRHIPFVDLYGPFAKEGTERVYFKGLDDHWSDFGQDLAARVVADALAERRLLRSR